MANAFYPELASTIAALQRDFDAIEVDRKKTLQLLSDYLRSKRKDERPFHLLFVCTHNSRRSHMAQIWAQTAASYYNINNLFCFSAGTETTAFNPRAIEAMRSAGFKISSNDEGENPLYKVSWSEQADPLIVFSKVYDHVDNPRSDFAAVMTCSHAEQNCPIIPGAEKRIAITYEDPKMADNSPEEASRYLERVHQIGREMFYSFSLLED